MAGDFQTILSIDPTKTGTTLASVFSDREALGQFFLGEEYLTAAVIMADCCNDEPRMLRPRYMLLCQSLELFLKSFLLDHNVARTELTRRPLNHDLAKLLDRCLEHAGPDHPFIALGHQAVIRELAPAASMFYFRYGHEDPATILNVASIHVPLMRDALDACRALCGVVRELVFPIPVDER